MNLYFSIIIVSCSDVVKYCMLCQLHALSSAPSALCVNLLAVIEDRGC